MNFSKEDKAAWLNSEVMAELEKIAVDQDVLSGPPSEAFESVVNKPEDTLWEEEDFKEEVDNFLQDDYDETIKPQITALNNSLVGNLEKVARTLTDKSNVQAAYRIEKFLYQLKDTCKEDE